MTGYPDEPPTEGRGPADMYNAVTVAFALLTAVWQQRRAGQGRFIDMSGREALACLLGDALQESAANGAHPTRQGNRDAYMAPHNCYPCQGQNQWISIAVATEDEWRALCGAMGQPDLADDSRFRNAPSRCANVEALDPIVGAWTAQRGPQEAMNLLQAVGVAAVPTFSAEGLFADPHVVEREAFQTVSHPKLGDVFIVGSPWRLSRTPPRITRHAPLFGQDTHYVIGEVLGLGSDEIERLEADKVLW
ncbi:MAG: CoA transferase [Chloroflexi bacterium]|nr:CoA transferase [Chloroflexota bacterium]